MSVLYTLFSISQVDYISIQDKKICFYKSYFCFLFFIFLLRSRGTAGSVGFPYERSDGSRVDDRAKTQNMHFVFYLHHPLIVILFPPGRIAEKMAQKWGKRANKTKLGAWDFRKRWY